MKYNKKPNSNYLSMRSLSFNKKLSLSFSALLTSLSNKTFLSNSPSFVTLISRAWPCSSTSMPRLTREYVGNLSIAVHIRASSSSSFRTDIEWISISISVVVLSFLENQKALMLGWCSSLRLAFFSYTAYQSFFISYQLLIFFGVTSEFVCKPKRKGKKKKQQNILQHLP